MRGKAPREFKPDEVPVPGFLPDLPDVRREVAQYFGSVHRMDRTVGYILKALKDSGAAADTLVLFASDHGMAFPYAKTTCYRAGTRSPWILRWPGVVKPGSVDRQHMLSNVDFMPTILEIANLTSPGTVDGRSFLPILQGKAQEGREHVYTLMNETSAGNKYPSRGLANKRYGYIFNAWANGKTEFKNESQAGLTFKAMQQAGASDKRSAERVEFFTHRVLEELYDYETDPHAQQNLAEAHAQQGVLKELRAELLKKMETVGDPQVKTLKKMVKMS